MGADLSLEDGQAAARLCTLNGLAVAMVRVWNPITQAYEPLKQAKVRVVLGENVDLDTLDESAETDDQGQYPESVDSLRGVLKRWDKQAVNPEYDKARDGS